MRGDTPKDKAVTICIWAVCISLLCMASLILGKITGWW